MFEIINKITFFICVGFVIVSLALAGSVFGANEAQYNSVPPFLSTEVPPNVMFMLDNSGSMKNTLAESGFDPTKTYYGMFDGTKKYSYDATIVVDPGGYNLSTNTDAPYDVAVDTTKTGAFVENNSCTIGTGNNCWDGSFLNWVVTRRIDAARKVMVGGKVESRTGYDYVTGDGGDLEWKIVANNERSDPVLNRTYSNSSAYTPYPNNTAFTVYSSAASGAVQTAYDPYAKIKAAAPAMIVNTSGNIIGEFGTISRCGADAGSHDWYTVSLAHNYANPVVVAVPLAYYGGDPAVTRVSDVDAASDTFKVRVEEWEYISNKKHTGEDISYLVFEAGSHVLSGGQIISAGTVATTDTGISVSFSPAFSTTPVVLSSVTTNNDTNTVTTRQSAVSSSSFFVKLQEEEAGGSHGSETVSYIALDPGSYTDGSNSAFQVGTQTGVDEGWRTVSFTNTLVQPSFLASMQTTNGIDPATLRYRNLDTNSVEVFVEEEKSVDRETGHAGEDVGYVVVSAMTTLELNLTLISEEEPKGLLHDISGKVRLGLSYYNYEKDGDIYNGEKFHGGTMKPNIPLNPFVKDAVNTTFREIDTPIAANIDDIVDAIEHYPLVWGTTPLAENYYDVIRYFQQEPSYYETVNSGVTVGDYYEVNHNWDPYYFADSNGDGTSDGFVPCAQSYVLVFTDGEPYRDFYLPGYDSTNDDFSGNVGDSADYDGDGSTKDDSTTTADSKHGNDALDDLALWGHSVVDQSTYAVTGKRDLRNDTGLESDQNLITYTVGFGSDVLKQILVDTADNGGGVAYAAEDGRQLKNQLTNAFTDILSRSSGTAASVISNTRSGEGGIYQSVFFPSIKDANNEVSWVGQVHALLVDSYGNMREDTNENSALDPAGDYFVVFNENGTADRYVDGDSNQKLELDTATCPSSTTPPAAVVCYDRAIDTVNLEDLHYLWNTSNWLNEISDADAEDQRSPYISATAKRYIFTWVDDDEDHNVDSTEVTDFVCSSLPSETDLTNTDEVYPFLNLYPSFADTPAIISSLSTTNLANFLRVQTKRQINYIRGSDCVNSSDAENCNTLNLQIGGVGISGTAMRSRKFDYDSDGTDETWRLGDIVYSTPTLVGRPAENYHLLYHDTSYSPYVYKYKNRRQVVYAGANDGMIHAFNAGFYDQTHKQFCRSSDFTNCQDSTAPALGAELWAYVPFNLLPHLYWLTQPSYTAEKHVYYVDQKPRIFDAKIFTEEAACRSVSGGGVLDQLTDAGCIHPNGWGTVMVLGMNLGGGSIIADINKFDPTADDDGDLTTPDASDPTMKSAFVIFDITNPEAEPELLAELNMPKMGFATSYPTVVTMRNGTQNQWFLAFGSGPADANGDPGTVDMTSGAYDSTVLNDVKSLQPGQFYLVDLVALASSSRTLSTLVHGTSSPAAGLNVYAAYDTNTFISSPVTADFDLDYNADVVYFGTVSGAGQPWGGKLRRIVINDQNDPINWDEDSIFLNVQKPIVAAPTVGQDDDDRNWVFFGTGRYFNADDKGDTHQQSFYGLKEPLSGGVKSWGTLTASTDLVDVSSYEVFTDLSVSDSSNNDWASLLTGQSVKEGWLLDFSTNTGERTLGQATLIGGLLSFTTFIPESDICSAGGESFLWGLYYKTGTAHYSAVLGSVADSVSGKQKAKGFISLGKGLATSPNIHTGRESGSSVFVQSSTGEITRIQEENPMSTKSGMASWRLLQ